MPTRDNASPAPASNTTPTITVADIVKPAADLLEKQTQDAKLKREQK
jgi:hypothetical protein